MKAIDNKELILALEELEKEKGIKKEYVLEAIETALVTAYKRNFDALENVKVDMSGIGRQLFCIDICGKEITDADVMKLAGTGLKTAMPILKKWLGREVNRQTQAVRILTQSKVYVVILDNQINSYNSDKLRKVFSSGVKFYISSNIISNSTSLKAVIDFMNGLKSLPVKRMKGGEVILAGKLENRWGGMIIKKK